MNKHLTYIPESINVALANKVREKIANGEAVIQLQTGDPDFATPKAIVNELANSLNNGNTHYCSSSGVSSLKRAVVEKLKSKNHFLTANSEQVTISHGAVQGIHLALGSIITPGDEVILIAPYWLAYQSNVSLFGAHSKVCNTQFDTGFQPDIEAIESLITPKTKAIIINTPNNPTGAVYSKQTLTSIGELCKKHGIFIISDEVYESLTYEAEHISIQSLFPKYEKIISVFSYSKTYAMTGWRLGYLYSSKNIAKQINKLIQFQSTCINPAIQSAGICALRDSSVQSQITSYRSAYQERRDKVLKVIKGSWLENCITIPQGAFYFWVDISSTQQDAIAFCEMILTKYSISLTPGNAFSHDYAHYIRFTFATETEELLHAVNTLTKLEF